MGLRIYETDRDAMPKRRRTVFDDIVGRFRSGAMIDGSAVSLATWRVTTGDQSIAERIAAKYGGEVKRWNTRGTDNLEILTDAKDVNVIVPGPDSVSSSLKLWSRNGTLLHHCDGVQFLSGEKQGEYCGCPKLLQERKELASTGYGPSPDIQITFRLAEMPDLGYFRMRSGSWKLAEEIPFVEEDLEKVGSALCTLAIEHISFIAKGGEMAGRRVSYKKPTLRVHGPAPSVGAASALTSAPTEAVTDGDEDEPF